MGAGGLGGFGGSAGSYGDATGGPAVGAGWSCSPVPVGRAGSVVPPSPHRATAKPAPAARRGSLAFGFRANPLNNAEWAATVVSPPPVPVRPRPPVRAVPAANSILINGEPRQRVDPSATAPTDLDHHRRQRRQGGIGGLFANGVGVATAATPNSAALAPRLRAEQAAVPVWVAAGGADGSDSSTTWDSAGSGGPTTGPAARALISRTGGANVRLAFCSVAVGAAAGPYSSVKLRADRRIHRIPVLVVDDGRLLEVPPLHDEERQPQHLVQSRAVVLGQLLRQNDALPMIKQAIGLFCRRGVDLAAFDVRTALATSG